MIRLILICAVLCGINTIPSIPNKPKPKANATRPIVPLPLKPREFVPPEKVGVPKDCPFPTVKKRLAFQCPCCGLRMWTHVLYPHLPHCPRDGCVMNEIEN